MKHASLFTGGMGLDIGLERAGFETIACVELNPSAVKTIKLNRPGLSVFGTSVENITGRDLLAPSRTTELDLLSGGPPCQSFSSFGARRGMGETRGQMIMEFIRLVSETQPKAFLMENVMGILTMDKGAVVEFIMEEFNKIGYNVNAFAVNSLNYGSCQNRARVLFIGNRFGYNVQFPKPEEQAFTTLGDVIGEGFEDPDPDHVPFSPRKLSYLSMVPAGGNWRDLPEHIQRESMGAAFHSSGGRTGYWRRLSFDQPCPTVLTSPTQSGSCMCHPEEDRAISVGEGAAIQGFPADWKFHGSAAQKFKQVGNAVPVRLGEVAGKVIADLINKIDKHGPSINPTLSGSVERIRPTIRTKSKKV